MSRYFNDFGAPSGSAVIRDDDGPSAGQVSTGNAADWNPYPAPSNPPMVQAVPTGSAQSTGAMDVLGAVVGGFVNIFGQRTSPQGQVIQQAPAMPGWIVPALIVGGVVVIGGVMLSTRGRRTSMAGYRRRSRRSRR